MVEPLEVDGILPDLAGSVCDELLVQQYWYLGRLVEPANVIYLQVNGKWHRLFFDCGIVFWRQSQGPTLAAPATEEEEFAYLLIDLGRQLCLRGLLLANMGATPIEGGSQVQVAFANGVTVAFRNVNDNTTYWSSQIPPDSVF